MAVLARSGKTAVTHYKVLEKLAGNRASLLECRLETGRTHQIRVHFASKNHSLVGDATYGQKPGQKTWAMLPEYVQKFPRQALHSCFIGFTHPDSGEWMEFESKLGGETSNDINKLIKELRAISN
jgi:23S rRNA pseudouridine1911/1915/1917 synthase